jgi:hypothetical protein
VLSRSSVPIWVERSDALADKSFQIKVKVKLSLCLTKHHAMKTYWGSGGQLHAPAVLPPGKEPLVSIGYEVRWAPEPF